MDIVYKTLEKERSKILEQISSCNNIEDKTELISNKKLIENAIQLLKKCHDYGISTNAIFTKLPQKQCDTPSSEYRIVEDGETDNPQHWHEVSIENKPFNHVRLGEGDIVVEC